MEPINNRMRELRKALGMSQLEFGEILHISKSGVCDLEAGRRKVQDSHIVMLKDWKKNGLVINEEWIRTGKGDMFDKLSLDKILSDISFGNDVFIKDFIEVYAELDASSRKALQEIAYKMAERIISKKEKGD